MSFRSNHILLLELKLSLTSPESKYGVFPSLNCPFIWLVLYFLSFSFKALQCLHCYDTVIHYLDSKASHKHGKPVLSALRISPMAPATKGKMLWYHTRELESLPLFTQSILAHRGRFQIVVIRQLLLCEHI